MPKVRSVIKPVSKGCSRFVGEVDDCTVRALANATDLPYDECHELMQSYGRVNGETMCSAKMMKAYQSVGLKFVAAFGSTKSAMYNAAVFNCKRLPGRTLAKLLPELHTGRYIVEIRGHVFAVVDGDVIDYGNISVAVSVAGLWKVEE